MFVIKDNRIRKILRISIPYVIIPLLIALGICAFDEKRYAVISLGIVFVSIVLFTCGFEKRNIGTRRMILVAILTSLAVAGRFIPIFKPITAIIVLTGIHLGGEAGFLTGAMAALISNFYFGQGPWTPFQMFTWGMIGLIAGYMSTLLIRSKISILIFGALAGIFYSMLMDVWTVVWYNDSYNPALYLTAIGTAVPFTLMYAASNVVFLLIFAKSFGEKLARIKLKYGI